MATRGTGKKYDEYLALQKGEGQKAYNEAENRVNDSAAKSIAEQNQVIDQSASTAIGQYQTRIDEAPKKFAGDFDGNLIDELVARKNLENTMADLGLTDSGLNRTQQTAISVMRGNADAETRRQQRNYVTAAEQAIDQVLAQAAADKATHANQVNANARSYLDELWASIQQNAATNATNLYNTQEENLTKQYVADVDYEAAIEKLAQEAAQKEAERLHQAQLKEAELASNRENTLIKAGYVQDKNGNWVKDTSIDAKDLTSQIVTYALKRVSDDNTLTMDDAMLEGKIVYGVADDSDKLTYNGKQLGYTGSALTAYVNAGGGEKGDEAAGEQIASTAHALINGLSFEVSGWKTFWRKADEGDGRLVGEKVKETLEKNETYKGMTTLEKSAAASFAIAKSVEESFPNESRESNLKRIRRACEEYTLANYDYAASYYISAQEPETQESKVQTGANRSDSQRVSDYYQNVGSMPGRLL